MIIGPASAKIVALGWMIVPVPIVMSPRSFDSSQTSAPCKILMLKSYHEKDQFTERTLNYLFRDIFINGFNNAKSKPFSTNKAVTFVTL